MHYLKTDSMGRHEIVDSHQCVQLGNTSRPIYKISFENLRMALSHVDMGDMKKIVDTYMDQLESNVDELWARVQSLKNPPMTPTSQSGISRTRR
jgi:hypothetical protein